MRTIPAKRFCQAISFGDAYISDLENFEFNEHPNLTFLAGYQQTQKQQDFSASLTHKLENTNS